MLRHGKGQPDGKGIVTRQRLLENPADVIGAKDRRVEDMSAHASRPAIQSRRSPASSGLVSPKATFA